MTQRHTNQCHHSSPTEKGKTMSVTNPCTYGTCTHSEHQRPQVGRGVQQKIVRARLFAAVEGVSKFTVPVRGHQSPLPGIEHSLGQFMLTEIAKSVRSA